MYKGRFEFIAIHTRIPFVSAICFQAGLGSTLFGSRREERRPLLFNLRATTLGTPNLAVLMFGKS